MAPDSTPGGPLALPDWAADGSAASAHAVRLHVCVTCGKAEGVGETAGRRLLDALAPALAIAGVPVETVAVECLSVCKRPCTVAASGPGRWTYVWGDIDPDADLPALVDGLARYAAAPDGIVPWRDRPERLRKGVVARIPPLPATLPTRGAA